MLILLGALFAPSKDPGVPFSSTSVQPAGTRALYETLQRLGFKVTRRRTSLADSLDPRAAYLVLGPSGKLTSSDHASLLRAVRAGATIIVTAGDNALTDSLGFELSGAVGQFHTLRMSAVVGGNPPAPRLAGIWTVEDYPLAVRVESSPPRTDDAFMWLVDPPYAANELASDQADSPVVLPAVQARRAPKASHGIQAVILGHAIGRGYAVLVGTPELVTNQLMRDRRPAIAIVRALERAGTADLPIVFDEYSHGLGKHSSPMRTVENALTDTPLGRTTLQAVAAALVLLLVFAIRPIAPLPAPSVTRRSPLEHVGALAHAYRQVGAQSLGASRLVGGLRRRHPLGMARSVPNVTYLAALRARVPAATEHVDRIAASLAPNSSDPIAVVGDAVANIERKFKSD